MQKFDVLIVGAGMVGLTLALALRKNTNLTIAIADTLPVADLTSEPEVRVSAINVASKTIFEHLDVWNNIEKIISICNSSLSHFNSCVAGNYLPTGRPGTRR